MFLKNWKLFNKKNEGFKGWLELVDFMLRKHGKILARDTHLIESTRISSDSIWIEGPINTQDLENLSIKSSCIKTKSFTLRIRNSSDDNFNLVSEYPIGAASDTTRKICMPGAKMAMPEKTKFDDPFSSTDDIQIQILNAPENWTTLAEIKLIDEESWLPVVITDGIKILCGLPLLALCIRRHWMPPFRDAYYGFTHQPIPGLVESWIVNLISEFANQRSLPLLEISKWPGDYNSALTIRHDHDRNISSTELINLLNFYNDFGIKSSWGFRLKSLPLEQLWEVSRSGHEIVLHSEAGSQIQLAAEKKSFEELTRTNLTGITSHGGKGSAGHLGQTYFQWASDSGFKHADILSRDNMYPHPALAYSNNKINVLPLFLPSLHSSLDKSSKPGNHRLETLKDLIPRKLALGQHATIMNHPDINGGELMQLIKSLDLKNVWCATHQQVTDWYRKVNFGCTLEVNPDGYRIEFINPLDSSLKVKFQGINYTIVAGASSFKFKNN